VMGGQLGRYGPKEYLLILKCNKSVNCVNMNVLNLRTIKPERIVRNAEQNTIPSSLILSIAFHHDGSQNCKNALLFI
jgi:hypothetical protein